MSFTRRRFVQANAAGFAALSLGLSPAQSSVALIRKPIPSSGELITAMGIGTNRYGVTTEEEKAPLRVTMAKFAELGGTVIDTAPSYGRGVSEEVLGELASDLNIQDQLFWATKVDGRLAGKDQIHASLKKLGVPKADLMQVHNLRKVGTLLPLLRDLKSEGQIRYVGITTSRHEQFEEMESLLSNQTMDFVQVNYSLADRLAAEKILPLAQEKGVAVLVNLPFARGRLFEKVGDRPLPDWAAEFDCQSWGNFFLKYLISHPAVTCPIPGTRKPSHLIDNMQAVTGRLPDPVLRRRQERFIDQL